MHNIGAAVPRRSRTTDTVCARLHEQHAAGSCTSREPRDRGVQDPVLVWRSHENSIVHEQIEQQIVFGYVAAPPYVSGDTVVVPLVHPQASSQELIVHQAASFLTMSAQARSCRHGVTAQ